MKKNFVKRIVPAAAFAAAAVVFAGCAGTGGESSTPEATENVTEMEAAQSIEATETTETTTVSETTEAVDVSDLPRAEDEDADELIAKFQTKSYIDAETGDEIEYNIYIPENYDESKKYPLIMFIADSSTVGRGVEAPLTQGIGGLVWASQRDQAKHESFVIVPSYDEVVIDDNNGYTTTDYLEDTKRLLDSVAEEYSIDADRIYTTGQSMGAMISLYLASEYPDYFAAQMIVDGQWKIDELTGLTDQKMFYFAAEGDDKAYAGQQEVLEMLEDSGVNVSTAVWDAAADSDTIEQEAADMIAKGNAVNMPAWLTGSTIDGTSPGRGGEHMSSFVHAYKVEAVRDWLFEQSR